MEQHPNLVFFIRASTPGPALGLGLWKHLKQGLRLLEIDFRNQVLHLTRPVKIGMAHGIGLRWEWHCGGNIWLGWLQQVPWPASFAVWRFFMIETPFNESEWVANSEGNGGTPYCKENSPDSWQDSSALASSSMWASAQGDAGACLGIATKSTNKHWSTSGKNLLKHSIR